MLADPESHQARRHTQAKSRDDDPGNDQPRGAPSRRRRAVCHPIHVRQAMPAL
jgi:hypothetical protein